MERPVSVQKEAEEIMQRTGRYIPPYKLACMTQTAAKIMKALTAESYAVSYEDCRFILEIVQLELNFAVGEET